MIGSASLFAPTGQYVPMGIHDAREKALQGAAVNAADLQKKKADAEAKAGIFKIPDAPQLTNKNYQRTFDKKFNKYTDNSWDEAVKIYGNKKDAARALKDHTTQIGREYQQGLSQFEYIAKHGNQMTDNIAKIQTAIDAGEMQSTPYIESVLIDAENALGDFEKGDPAEVAKIGGKIEAIKNLDKHLKDSGIVTAEMRDISQSVGSPQDYKDYDAYYKVKTKKVAAAADRLANQMTSFGGTYAGAYKRGLITKEAISDAVEARLGTTREVSRETVATGNKGKDAYEDTGEVVIKYDEFNNAQIAGDVDKKSTDGYRIPDASGIPEGIKPSDKVKLSQIQVTKKDSKGNPMKDDNGNLIMKNIATFSVQRTVTEYDPRTKKNETTTNNYVVTANADGDARGYLQREHQKEYNASQQVAKSAGVTVHSGTETGKFKDPKRGNNEGREGISQGIYQGDDADVSGNTDETISGKEANGLTKEEEEFFK
jgi:hypothetical protein